MALNCLSEPMVGCGKCRNCRRIAADMHPDVLQLSPSGVFFKIGQIRDLLATLAMKPYEARHRVVLLNDAHTMTPAAGNALLKILEEPPPQTILVLTAPQASDLLPTIVSRCHHLRFQPIVDAVVIELLIERCGVTRQDAVVLSALAGGSIAKALAQHETATQWRQRRDWLAEQYSGLESMGTTALLAVAEHLAKDGKRVVDSLELLKSWLRDLMVVRHRPSMAIHKDRVKDHRPLAANQDAVCLAGRIALIQEAQRALLGNAAVRLTLESLLLALAERAHGDATRVSGA